MANTYTQMYVQVVFAVKGRQSLISEAHRILLEKYMCGIISNNKSKPLAIYCNPDHTHILIGFNPSASISDLVRDIKSSSSKWLNHQHWMLTKFNWQSGYGAFTYSKSQIGNVIKYILNQKEHHKKSNFIDEYKLILDKSGIEYDEKYLFN